MPACNGHFGAMAALAPQQRQWKLGSYYPAASVLEAATAPSPGKLNASGGPIPK